MVKVMNKLYMDFAPDTTKNKKNEERIRRMVRIENWNKIHFAPCEFCHVYETIAIHATDTQHSESINGTH